MSGTISLQFSPGLPRMTLAAGDMRGGGALVPGSHHLDLKVYVPGDAPGLVVQGTPGVRGPAGVSGVPESGPSVTWNPDGTASRIDYDSGNFKLLSYLDGRLAQMDYHRGTDVFRKTFTYNPDGSLAGVVETVV